MFIYGSTIHPVTPAHCFEPFSGPVHEPAGSPTSHDWKEVPPWGKQCGTWWLGVNNHIHHYWKSFHKFGVWFIYIYIYIGLYGLQNEYMYICDNSWGHRFHASHVWYINKIPAKQVTYVRDKTLRFKWDWIMLPVKMLVGKWYIAGMQ